MTTHSVETQEQWRPIEEFPTYSISDQGNVHNHRYDRPMRTNPNNYGHMKVTLTDEETGERYDRSIVKLVAEAFCKPPSRACNRIAALDGDIHNTRAENLVWRTGRYAWKYSRQLKEEQPTHYKNLKVQNTTTGAIYENIIEAGMTEGLLFDEIWRSTYTGEEIFPFGHIFEVIDRV